MATPVGTCRIDYYWGSGKLRIIGAWTSDASGDVEHILEGCIGGRILTVRTVPDVDAIPTAYDITLEDPLGIDRLLGKAAGRSVSEPEIGYVYDATYPEIESVIPAMGAVLKIAGAGNAASGVFEIMLDRLPAGLREGVGDDWGDGSGPSPGPGASATRPPGDTDIGGSTPPVPK